ncbi:hypothetical protein, partial [Gemmiger sp.]|uniref:hypothetical protein n=1 Tax=Gemmiger sp. TaxID=2049027 RepID=UPI00307E114D
GSWVRVPDGAPQYSLTVNVRLFFNDCRILAADLDKSQRLILYFERNSRTFSVMETVAYMQLPIKVSNRTIS